MSTPKLFHSEKWDRVMFTGDFSTGEISTKSYIKSYFPNKKKHLELVQKIPSLLQINNSFKNDMHKMGMSTKKNIHSALTQETSIMLRL